MVCSETKISPGNYTQGRIREKDVAKRLHALAKHDHRYGAFAFAYAPTAKAVYDKGCEDLHDFGGTE
jgi:hypothetical protein